MDAVVHDVDNNLFVQTSRSHFRAGFYGIYSIPNPFLYYRLKREVIVLLSLES